MRSPLFLVAGLLAILVVSPSAVAQGPLPILRGIVLMESGEGRAYFEDPRTGMQAGYAPRDTVGDCQIEQIQEDRVVLRRGSELVQMLLGAQAPAGGRSPRSTGSTAVSPPSSAIRSTPGAAPIIGNGQPWLDRLGIPLQALSRAIEQALPAQNSDNLDD